MQKYNSTNSTVLLYLCRAYYTRAVKLTSYDDLSTALKFAQNVGVANFSLTFLLISKTDQALHLKGLDDQAILYNIAIIEQKSLDMMIQHDDPSRRSLADVEHAIAQTKHAHKFVLVSLLLYL
jgi:hypothetical protein